MKYVLIITLLLALALFLYWRLRPYLKMASNVLGFVREVRRMSEGARQHQQQERQETPASSRRGAGRTPGAADERLVRCSSCGTWLPASRAITLRGSNEAYCSRDCVERPAADDARAKTFRR